MNKIFLNIILVVAMLVVAIVATYTLGILAFVGALLIILIFLGSLTGSIPVLKEPKLFMLILLLGIVLIIAGVVYPHITTGQVIETYILRPLGLM